jgi:hypothetical protein
LDSELKSNYFGNRNEIQKNFSETITDNHGHAEHSLKISAEHKRSYKETELTPKMDNDKYEELKTRKGTGY